MDANVLETLDGLIAAELPRMVELRHDLHAHPQLGYEETYASARVQEHLKQAGVPFQAPVATTGVVGWILPDDKARGDAKAVGLRGDMDALPIQEETGLPYASQNPGLAHACGHDGHTAMLVGAARVLAKMRRHLPRPVKLFFQPAEEGGAGALKMVQAGALGRDIGGLEVAMMFALHAKADIQTGKFAVAVGPCCAQCNEITITVTGQGGHAARPETLRDPIVAAAAVIMNLQSIVSRNVRPLDAAVVSISQIHAGSKNNIIPPSVCLNGTVRTLDDAVAQMVFRRMEEIVAQTAAAMGCAGLLQVHEGFPVTRNDARAARYASEAAGQVSGPANVLEVGPGMGAEDFSYFAQRVAACFIWVGMKPPGGTFPNAHTAQFDFNDQMLGPGMKLLCLLALNSDHLA